MTSAPPNILIIEEDRMLKELLVRALKSEGFAVNSVESAKDAALHLASGATSNVVILNPHIPDGWALAQSIRTRGSTKIVALITSGAELTSTERALVDAVVDKAAPATGLIATIRPLLPVDALPQREEGPVVLVVDDEEEIRSLLSDFLVSGGYTVLLASNGNEALDVIKREAGIAVILLDIMLPGKGGVEVLKEIMKRRRHPAVIIMSGLADAEIAQSAIRLGAFDYVLKPINLTALEGLIGATIALSESRRGLWSA
jgi:DNA-binding response OmpR family regulator